MPNKTYTAGIYTFGCKVNQYESEAISEQLETRGIQMLPATEKCDIYIINTCTVTAESDRKARQFIRRVIAENPSAFVAVTGCFAQVSPEKIAKIEGVDLITGNSNKLSLVDAVMKFIEIGKKNSSPEISVSDIDAAMFEQMSISHFDRTRAYIKIEDGCESRCTYCIIPHARGKIRSKCPEKVIEEVRSLTRSGCLEVVLTGIETASYGKDIEGTSLADILAQIDKIEGIGRVRLGSLDPSLIKQSFVDKIAPLSSLAPHFHLSLQSGSDAVLARMKRKYNSRMALEAIERLRDAIAGVQFTTDVIVGFPGETEEDFEETMEFAKRARFLMIHVFPYSKRPGTPAADMPDQVDERIKKERVAKLIALSKEIRREILAKLVEDTPTVEVLFESMSEDGYAIGHTPSFIEVRAKSDVPLHSEIRKVRIEAFNDECCYGSILET